MKCGSSELRGVAPSDAVAAADFDDREMLRARWDGIEGMMRAYLAGLQDEMLSDEADHGPGGG